MGVDFINKFPWLKNGVVYLALIQSLAATLGSLYFSEIKHYSPCVLCWYQRILMYPLVILLTVGIFRKDRGLYLYVLPMSILGGGIALYQILLQNGVLPKGIAICNLGGSCLTKYTGYFGFLTIPMMSLIAFTVITLCMLTYKKLQSEGSLKV